MVGFFYATNWSRSGRTGASGIMFGSVIHMWVSVLQGQTISDRLLRADHSEFAQHYQSQTLSLQGSRCESSENN
jgi:hypothetical protein